MRSLIFIFTLFVSLVFTIESQGTGRLNGSWQGKLALNPELSLRLVINISDADKEKVNVTMDSPDQGAYGIPMQIDELTGDSIILKVPQLKLTYRGRLEADSIIGRFTQGLLTLPLTLRPKTETLSRPQTPVPPFPYKTEEIKFKSALDSALLYGTLTFPPEVNSDTPAVILISGSGTQNRDEEIFDHKPFAVIADFLARNGIATLRYDDRGYDVSSGLLRNPTTFESALDAEGAVRNLRERGFKKIGLLGHSEGGLIADMVAVKDDDIKFIIEMGGPAVSGDSILIYQNEYLLKDGSMPSQYISMYIDAMRGLFQSQKNKNPKPFKESEYEIFSSEWSSHPVVAPLVKNLRENFMELNPWLRFFINYDPMNDIRKIKAPVLFLYGENDSQVPPELNIPVIEKEYPLGVIKLYPGLNHLMQNSNTGKVAEYADIEETISPQVLEDIVSFIKNL